MYLAISANFECFLDFEAGPSLHFHFPKCSFLKIIFLTNKYNRFSIVFSAQQKTGKQ